MQNGASEQNAQEGMEHTREREGDGWVKAVSAGPGAAAAALDDDKWVRCEIASSCRAAASIAVPASDAGTMVNACGHAWAGCAIEQLQAIQEPISSESENFCFETFTHTSIINCTVLINNKLSTTEQS